VSSSGVSYEEFRREALRLQPQATGHPGRHRAGVVAFATLGYTCILGIVLVLPVALWLMLLGQAGDKLAVLAALATPALLAFCIASARTLWVRFPEPTGARLAASDAPPLFELIGELCRRLEAPWPDEVLISPDFNACVLQRPMLGVFGRYRNYLMVGWPLMQGLTTDQFRSVLAHEFGHLSRNHGRLGSWIYRQKVIWSSLREHLEAGEDGSVVGSALIGRFIRWYEPRFAARSFALAREHEYEADRCAVEMTSREVAAESLVRIVAAGRWVAQEYQSARRREGEINPEPPADYFTRMAAELGRPLPEESAASWVREAWSRPTDLHDIHPALADRLRAMGVENPDQVPGAAIRPGPSAGSTLLGARNEQLGRELDQGWRQFVALRWRAKADEARVERAQLAALARTAEGRALTEKEALERVRLTSNLDGHDAAESLAAAFLEQHAAPPMVRFILGIALVQRGEEAGVTHLRIAMEREPSMRWAGSAVLFEYFWPRGRMEEAELVRQIGLIEAEATRRADLERRRLDNGTRFAAHGLPLERVAALRKALDQIPQLTEAYLVRRVVKLQPRRASYILAIRFQRPRFYLRAPLEREEAMRARLLEWLQWPEETNAFLLRRKHRMVRRQLRRWPGATLLRRRQTVLRLLLDLA